MKRIVPFIAGAVLLALATESAYGLYVSLRASERVELAGIQFTFAVAMAIMGVGLLRQSIFEVPRSAGGNYILYLFGYGWLMGVIVNSVISQVRATRPTYESPFAVALDVFSLLVVTLILAIPGLISLVIARRL